MRKSKRDTTLRPQLRRLAQALAFLFVVNTFVLPQLAGTGEAISLIGDLDPRLLTVGFVAEMASLACVAYLIRSLLPEQDQPSFWTVQRIVLAARGASRVVPGGAAVGGVVTYRLLRRVGVPTSEAGFSVGTQSLESAAVLVVLLFAALVVSVPISGLNAAYLTVTAIGLIILLGLAGLVVAITKGEERVVNSARRMAEAIRVINPDSVEGSLRTLASQLARLTTDRRELTRHALWSAAYWLLGALSLWVFLGAYGHWTRIDGLVIGFALANIVATIPITPGGLGVMEIALVTALLGFGVPPGVALLGVVSWRLVNFWAPIPIGAATYLSLRLGRPDQASIDDIEELAEETRLGAQEISPWRRRPRQTN